MPCHIVVDTSAVAEEFMQCLLAMKYFDDSILIWSKPVTDELQRHGESADPHKKQLSIIGSKTLLVMLGTPGIKVVLDYGKQIEQLVDDDLLRRAKEKKAKLLTKDTKLARKAICEAVPVIFLLDIMVELHRWLPKLPALLPASAEMKCGDMLRIKNLKPSDKVPEDAIAYTDDHRLVIVKGGAVLRGCDADVRVLEIRSNLIMAVLVNEVAMNGVTLH